MQLRRKLAPLLNIVVGIFALMIPTPTPGQPIREFAPLPPIAMLADADVAEREDPVMVMLHQQARTALLRLQAAQARTQ